MDGFSPVLLVSDPVRVAPRSYRPFTTGSALLRFAGGSNGFRSIWPERPGEEYADRISAFFGVLRGWITDSGGQNSSQVEPDVSRTLDERIKELATAGFVVSARERFLLLTGGRDAKPQPWRIVDIKVQPAVPVKTVDAGGNDRNPIRSDGPLAFTSKSTARRGGRSSPAATA
jgi:hypothetical protein